MFLLHLQACRLIPRRVFTAEGVALALQNHGQGKLGVYIEALQQLLGPRMPTPKVFRMG